jgi:hypothetical protein
MQASNPYKFTKDNSFFVCHRCSYTTHLKNDMTKHYHRKTLCDLTYVPDNGLTSDEYYKLSVTKRFVYSGKKPKIMPNSIFMKLINEYDYRINYIDFDDPSTSYHLTSTPITIDDNSGVPLSVDSIENFIDHCNKKTIVQRIHNQNIQNIMNNNNDNLYNNLRISLDDFIDDNVSSNLYDISSNILLDPKDRPKNDILGQKQVRNVNCNLLHLLSPEKIHTIVNRIIQVSHQRHL